MIRACTAMLPRLQAEERLADHNVMLAASGNMLAIDRSNFLADLQRRASGATRRRAARPTPAVLAAMGIGVRSNALSEASEKGVSDG